MFNITLTYFQLILLITILAISPFILIAGILLRRAIRANRHQDNIERILLSGTKPPDETKKSKSVEQMYVDFWASKLKPAGVVDVLSDNKKNASYLLMVSSASYLLSLLITQNFIFGVIPVAAIHGGLLIYCENKIKKNEAILSAQVPGFLSALKSNIQSNATPQLALISAIENTAMPLRGELEIVRNLIQAGSFESALSALRSRTTNEYIKFLCSCIELSNEVGANLEDQITTIEKLIVEKQELSNKIDVAVAGEMPILYVSGVLIPVVFIYMYVNQESTRDYWFHSMLSWVIFGAVIGIVAFGTYMGLRAIKKVRNM